MTENQRLLAVYRLGIVEGLLRAIDGGGNLVEILRSCDSVDSANQTLSADPWRFNPTVITHILDMSYRQLTGDGALLRNEATQLQHLLATSP